jgi:hypothetical protein
VNSYNGFSPQQRYRALDWLKGEYRAGRRHRPTVCDACGQTEGIIEAHSEDYSEPFGDHIGAFGLCYRCHMMIHCRFRSRAAWDTYRQAVREGKRFQAMHSRNFPEFSKQLRGGEVAFEVGASPERLVLDEIDAYLHRPGGEPKESSPKEPSLKEPRQALLW